MDLAMLIFGGWREWVAPALELLFIPGALLISILMRGVE